jgi:hypothetical protein
LLATRILQLAGNTDSLSFLPRPSDSNSIVEFQEQSDVEADRVHTSVGAGARGAYGLGTRAAEQAPAATITAQEAAETLAALKPPKRERPLVAVLGLNQGSETTDYLVPFGVLKRSGVADVFALGIRPGSVTLMRALTILPDATATEFDQRFPEGADHVIGRPCTSRTTRRF